jgi:hypothetical protein
MAKSKLKPSKQSRGRKKSVSEPISDIQNVENTQIEPVVEFQIVAADPDKPKTESRSSPRIDAELRTIVQGHSDPDEKWKEVTRVTTVSRNGAGFVLARPCQVGTLLALVLPMPPALRAYDVGEELYPIMGLVQYCHELTVENETGFRVGVAFVGKHIPESYHQNSMQHYHISGTAENGLWRITESDKPFLTRMATRFSVPVEATVSLMQKYQREIDRETTVTKNISATGACVPCSLEVSVGERVKFASRDHNFYAIAIVRNLRQRPDEVPSMHLEFVDEKFPVAKVLAQPNVNQG